MSRTLCLKLFLVPVLILGITLAGRRWGPAVAGWLSAFPVISSPILFFIATEQGAAFAAVSAIATLSAVLANLCFGLAYAWPATRSGWRLSIVSGLSAFAVAVLALNQWAPTLPLACGAVFGTLFVAPYCYPSGAGLANLEARSGGRSDLGWRMTAAGLLVLLVTGFASTLGPRMSGLLAMFPVMGSVLAVFSHRQYGPAFAILLLKNMVWGYYAFAVFCAVLAVCLPLFTVQAAFVLALGAAVSVQAAMRFVLR